MSKIRHAILPPRPIMFDHHKGGMRPVWRGRLHALGFLTAIPFVILLALHATPENLPGVIIYSISLLAVLGVSASYHLFSITPKQQTVMSRIDRAMIYILIAGTYTPIVLTTTPSPKSTIILTGVWLAAAVGVFLRSLGLAPKTSVTLYIAIGWVALLIAGNLWAYSIPATLLIILGGVAYTTGVVFYASKRPRLSETHFGHHELFHAFTIVGFASHYAAVWLIT